MTGGANEIYDAGRRKQKAKREQFVRCFFQTQSRGHQIHQEAASQQNEISLYKASLTAKWLIEG